LSCSAVFFDTLSGWIFFRGGSFNANPDRFTYPYTEHYPDNSIAELQKNHHTKN
jgi:hypothetical protein